MASPSNRQSGIGPRNRGLLYRFGLLSMVILLPIIAASIRLEPLAAGQPSDQTSAAASTTESQPIPAITTPRDLNGPSFATEKRQTLKRRETEALAATKELRELIGEKTHLIYSSDGNGSHTMTAVFLCNSLAKLGRFEEVEQLQKQIHAAGNQALVKAARQYANSAFTEYVARGNYVAAAERLKRSAGNDQYVLISGAIRNGDIVVADRLIDADMKNRGKNFNSNRLADLLANHATAAHWLGDEAIVLRALRRCRSLIEKSPQVSERPLDEDINWLRTDNTFGPYFVLVLASCGKAEMAERLWMDEELREQSASWRVADPALNLCHRLVLAGETDRALRISRQDNDGDIATELLHTLCLQAARDGDTNAAKQFADRFLAAMGELSFTYQPPRSGKQIFLSEQGQVLDRLRKAASMLSSFIQVMEAEEQNEIARAAAETYVKLANRFVDEFENRSTVSDVHMLRVTNLDLFPFSLEPIVEILPPSELHEFASRQQQFFARNHSYLQSGFRLIGPREAEELALAKIGSVPKELTRFSIRQRCELMERLLLAGEPGAQSVFDSMYKEVLKVAAVSFVSGSAGGRVVNGATQHRYSVANLAAASGQLKAGIEIIDTIEHPGEKVDGYRCLAQSYAEATEIPTALAWAKSLPSEDLQLAAFVGILRSAADKIAMEKPDELNSYLNELQRLGRPLFMWGC